MLLLGLISRPAGRFPKTIWGDSDGVARCRVSNGCSYNAKAFFGPSFVYTNTDDSEKRDIVYDDDENQFAKGQKSRDLRGRADALRETSLKLNRVEQVM
jgi:hypothetical protein